MGLSAQWRKFWRGPGVIWAMLKLCLLCHHCPNEKMLCEIFFFFTPLLLVYLVDPHLLVYLVASAPGSLLKAAGFDPIGWCGVFSLNFSMIGFYV